MRKLLQEHREFLKRKKREAKYAKLLREMTAHRNEAPLLMKPKRPAGLPRDIERMSLSELYSYLESVGRLDLLHVLAPKP